MLCQHGEDDYGFAIDIYDDDISISMEWLTMFKTHAIPRYLSCSAVPFLLYAAYPAEIALVPSSKN